MIWGHIWDHIRRFFQVGYEANSKNSHLGPFEPMSQVDWGLKNWGWGGLDDGPSALRTVDKHDVPAHVAICILRSFLQSMLQSADEFEFKKLRVSLFSGAC